MFVCFLKDIFRVFFFSSGSAVILWYSIARVSDVFVCFPQDIFWVFYFLQDLPLFYGIQSHVYLMCPCVFHKTSFKCFIFFWICRYFIVFNRTCIWCVCVFSKGHLSSVFFLQDLPLFYGIQSDLFPGVVLPTPDLNDFFQVQLTKEMNAKMNELLETIKSLLYQTVVDHKSNYICSNSLGLSGLINVVRTILLTSIQLWGKECWKSSRSFFADFFPRNPRVKVKSSITWSLII